MVTRFYLPINGTPTITPAFSASWEETASAVRLMTYPYRSLTTITTSQTTHVNAATNDVLSFQYISEPIEATTISGTIKGIIRVSENIATNDCRAQLVVKVMSGDGLTERGVLLAENAGALASEYALGTLTNRKFPLAWAGTGTALSSVAALSGDRIVIEIGTRFHAATAGTIVSFSTGDASTGDLAENETATTASTPWIEVSHDVTFIRNVSVATGVSDTQYLSNDIDSDLEAEMASLCGQAGGSSLTTFYIMRGKDVDCGTTPPTYRVWTVTDEPDTTGAFYAGTKCGATALQDIVVVKKITV